MKLFVANEEPRSLLLGMGYAFQSTLCVHFSKFSRRYLKMALEKPGKIVGVRKPAMSTIMASIWSFTSCKAKFS
jgi:hypothetical protein